MIALAKHFLNEQIGGTNTSLDVYLEKTASNTIYYICQGLQANLGHGGLFLFDGKTSLGDRYMAENADVKAVVTSGLRSIGDSCFIDCANLAFARFNWGFETIGDRAFYNCTNLQHFYLMEAKKIGSQAFYGCPFTTLWFNGTVAQWNAVEKSDDWSLGSAITTIGCKDGSIRI